MTESKKPHAVNILFWSLAALRIIFVIIPQHGYIHPDEYFQSMEVLAGRIFNVEHNPPWEFYTTHPIRSITIPYFTIGLSYIFLRNISNFAMEYLFINVLSPYFLLVVPRLLMSLFSLAVDYSLVKICLNNNEKYSARLLVLGTSYVMIVYATRTFSNSIELMLFSLLLYFVCESQTFCNELKRKQDYIEYRYEKSKSTAEKAKFHKLKLCLISDNYRNCFLISTITVLGVFNRPTFIGYAVLPIFFWINRGVDGKKLARTQFHARIIYFIICSIPAIIVHVLIDSFYYGCLTWGEIGMMEISINNFVITPFNFIKYNANSSNLQEHGLHPRFLHLLINIPLLFNVLGIFGLYAIGKYVYWGFCEKFSLLPSVRSIKMLMTMSFISPLLILSMFPHQEPRFLIPLILPLIYLHGNSILPDFETTLGTIRVIGRKPKNVKMKMVSTKLFKAWLVINALLVGFYGFLHQGGVYPSVDYLHRAIQLTSTNTEFHIITSNMYTLPQSFLLQSTSDGYTPRQPTGKRIYLYEEGSKDLHIILNEVKNLLKIHQNSDGSKYYKVYFFTLKIRQQETETHMSQNGIFFNRSVSVWPHLSTEAMPDLSKYCFIPALNFHRDCEVVSLWDYFQKIVEMCELIIYELSLSP